MDRGVCDVFQLVPDEEKMNAIDSTCDEIAHRIAIANR
jgi:hypothetical protein